MLDETVRTMQLLRGKQGSNCYVQTWQGSNYQIYKVDKLTENRLIYNGYVSHLTPYFRSISPQTIFYRYSLSLSLSLSTRSTHFNMYIQVVYSKED
eukprot:sb/3479141/